MNAKKVLTRFAGVLIVLIAGVTVLAKTALAADIPVNSANFPDSVFREWISEYADKDRNGVLTPAEIRECDYIAMFDVPVQSLKGIENFKYLQELTINVGQLRGSLDLNGLIYLQYLEIVGNKNLTRLEIGNCKQLIRININETGISSVDLSKMTQLEEFAAASTELISVDFSNCRKLEYVDLDNSRITSIDVSMLPNLRTLNCSYTGISSLNVQNNPNLSVLTCHQCNLHSLYLGSMENLGSLECGMNDLTSLDVSQCNRLSNLECYGNRLTAGKTLYLNDILTKVLGSGTAYYETLWHHRTIMYSRYDDDCRGWLTVDNIPASGAKAKIGFVMPDDNIRSYSANVGSVFTIPKLSCVNDGAYFMGWARTEHATQPEFKSGDKLTVYRDTLLFPVWKKHYVKLTFDANGGKGAPSAKNVMSGTPVSIPKSTVSRENYYFLGWARTKDAKEAEFKSGDVILVDLPTQLFAVWKGKTVYLTFDKNGGTGTAPGKITTTYGSTVTIPKCSLTQTGYWFLGWATDPSATTAQYKSGSKLTMQDSTTLYAVWKKK